MPTAARLLGLSILWVDCATVQTPEGGISYSASVPRVTNAQSLPLSHFAWSDGETLHIDFVELSAAGLRADGQEITRFEGGLPTERRGKLITPLYDFLAPRAEQHRTLTDSGRSSRPFDGQLLLAVDAATPFETVMEAVYTAGQAHYDVLFLVRDRQAPAYATPTFGGRGSLAQVTLDKDGGVVVQAGEHTESSTSATLPADLRRLLQGQTGCVTVQPAAGVPWSRVATALDAVEGQDNLLSVVTWPTASRPSARGEKLGRRVTVSSADRIAVLPARLVSLENRRLDRPRGPVPPGQCTGGPPAVPVTDLEQEWLNSVLGLGDKRSPPSTARGTTKLTKVTLSGALDSGAYAQVVRRSIGQFRYCYQRELAQQPDLGGTLVLTITIGADGSVEDVVTSETSLGASGVEDCIIGKVRRLHFPPSILGTRTAVQTFVFE